MLLALVLAVAPAQLEAGPTAYTPSALLMVSDFGATPRLRVMDPGTSRIVYDYDFSQQANEGCNKKGAFCSPLGMHYSNIGGDDYLDMAMFVWNPGVVIPPRSNRYYSVVQRVHATKAAEVIWKIKGLDWSGIPDAASYCPSSTLPGQLDSGCLLELVHAFQIIDDQPDQHKVTVIMAEFVNSRITQATLDYSNGNTVAHVDWVLGKTNPDWPSESEPNAVRYITDQPGGPYLITTFYAATGVQQDGGLFAMWTWNGDGWDFDWRFPDPDDADISLLNTPHMGEVLVDPTTNKPWIFYSHSRGSAPDWADNTVLGGSFGLLEPGPTLADPPTYLFDAVLLADQSGKATHFSRDVDFLADGSLLLTDAACENASQDCPYPARVFHVNPLHKGATATSKPGYYSPDHTSQNLFNVPDSDVLAEYQCGFQILFESDWVPGSQVGKSLLSAAQTTTTACPPPQ